MVSIVHQTPEAIYQKFKETLWGKIKSVRSAKRIRTSSWEKTERDRTQGVRSVKPVKRHFNLLENLTITCK